MSAAADRIASLDSLPAEELCSQAETSLQALVTIMNEETTLLRAGRFRDAAGLTAQKTQLAQDYVVYARSVQRQTERLSAEAPNSLDRLHRNHDSLATQMAENLRVIATAKTLAEDILVDVADTVGAKDRTRTYNRNGEVKMPRAASARGIAVNRAL
jgi:flagellar biosynthesis/type III secretory pathway chaperone